MVQSTPATCLPLFAKRFVLLFACWLALASGDPSAWLSGGLASAAAVAVGLRFSAQERYDARIAAMLRQWPRFVWRSLLGGLDVASRAFDPRLPLDPRWLSYPVRLPPGAPRAWLGAIVSLVPGTLAAGTSGDDLYVHCLDGEAQPEAQIASEEGQIARVFGLTVDDRHG
ncbi:Na+/H+ antiporter subunit E [Methylosinus sp. KRF6]|uniref:Na+/H+ antiporter subunit E n=1 Tax=Methylosinus sp. KRF6 TaxID=2846853 RepID=UPI001C0E47EE|nr:Na+/H+ antiporter subunit E [Methylosinus sp. KRF6]MBU3888520.1 Na+/H+ antiporter subunit E [Methylosinus sp. KRF6]